ncbi:YciI family protein [Rathayibacter toxicus]|uniref:YciI family protein n=1 Tax=Rathayibacter toxicus TaxID=145458 RepID=UPI000CE8F00E|nr:YciI family protein [Rathayibacter toxicus]PPI56776.1 hypothetical protein C5D35_00535 [Rathayibacter toxicus]QOD10463.1 YciI family protein [Rathayibacter toxicus]QWL27200.1 YciI family protein [Rathayibacter toxicus]QWL29335.1 YciI family protein [Rathayibacter toxicus]
MKYMLIMRATDAAKEAYAAIPFDEIITRMGRYNEALIDARVLVAGEGLSDDVATSGFVVDFSSEPPTVVDGPYGQVQERFNGFWIIEVESREQAQHWALRCPLMPGDFLEVRRVTDESDFVDYADNEYLKKEALWREQEATRAAPD